MTTALPAQATPSDSPLPDMHHLRLVDHTAQVGFAEDVTRPEIRPVAPTDSPPVQQTGGGAVRIDAARHVAEMDGRELDLTYLEFGLLAHLVHQPHQVHSREQLIAGIWGYDHIGDGRTVDVHIARLRRKLGTNHRHRIVTVRRVGYKYVPDQHESPNTAPCHRS
ncbi:winged helix-turn-helix domain-containing protein [Streptomyces sp. NPDC006208]|uniref:winged helix-turn-helix domain-containing protein n=1 Tax=Streptomyces sp. NPDC006208 TaxID=3156734 RepID=UPI0033B9330D